MRGAAIGALSALILVLLAGRPATAQGFPLDVVLVLEQSAYQPGEQITFTARVSNLSNQPVTINFATTQRIDVSLQSEAAEIDRLSRTRSFAPVMSQQTWAPGEIVTFSDSWQPRSTLLPMAIGAGPGTDQPIPRGTFRAVAQLTGMNVRPVSRPEILIIGAPMSLAAGCTTVDDPPFTFDLPVSVLIRAIEPPNALRAIWQRSAPAGAYAGYMPRPQAANDLQVINRLFPITICLNGPGRIILP